MNNPIKPLLDTELEAIWRRVDVATPGPWTYSNWPSVIRPRQPTMSLDPRVNEYPRYAEELHSIETYDPTLPDHGLADAIFIAAARQDIPALRSHIDYLNILIRDLAQDDVGEAYRRGYKDGQRQIPLLV